MVQLIVLQLSEQIFAALRTARRQSRQICLKKGVTFILFFLMICKIVALHSVALCYLISTFKILKGQCIHYICPAVLPVIEHLTHAVDGLTVAPRGLTNFHLHQPLLPMS